MVRDPNHPRRHAALKVAGVTAALAALGTGGTALKIYLEDPATYLKTWDVNVVKATTPEQLDEAYKLRSTQYGYFDPDSEQGKAMGLKMENGRMTDKLDGDPRSTVFLITKHGQPIGTFRLTNANDEDKGWFMDAIFAPKDLEKIGDRANAMEGSWMAVDKDALITSPLELLRAVIQGESVLAIEMAKAALAHAREEGKTRMASPALESQRDFFSRVDLQSDALPVHARVMDRDDVTIAVSDLQRMVSEAPEPIRKAIDPKGQWAGKGR